MKRWQCSVCGYIHTGDEPPEKCPVCGADKSKFVELVEEKEEKNGQSTEMTEVSSQSKSETTTTAPESTTAAEPPKSQWHHYYNQITDLMIKHHAHPISVHVPNGVLPISVFFVIIAALFHSATMEIAAICNMVYVLVIMPAVLFTGYNEWQKKYNGARTDLFLTKIICGITVLSTAFIIVIWWIANPDIASSTSSGRWLFVLVNLVMLGAAGLAGFLGGKLVFKD